MRTLEPVFLCLCLVVLSYAAPQEYYFPFNGSPNDTTNTYGFKSNYAGNSLSFSTKAACSEALELPYGQNAALGQTDLGFNFSDPFSISFWIRTSYTSYIAAFYVGATSGTWCSGSPQIVLQFSGNLRFLLYDGSKSDTINFPNFSYDSANHIIVNHDGTTLRAYVNGTLVGEKTRVANPGVIPGPANLGPVGPCTNSWIYGSMYIDELRMTNYYVDAQYTYADFISCKIPVINQTEPEWPLGPNCNCMAAKNAYAKSEGITTYYRDPIWYYENVSPSDYDCGLCAPENQPLWDNDDFCACDAAIEEFVSFYSHYVENLTAANAWEYWKASTLDPTSQGPFWDCNVCMTQIVDTCQPKGILDLTDSWNGYEVYLPSATVSSTNFSADFWVYFPYQDDYFDLLGGDTWYMWLSEGTLYVENGWYGKFTANVSLFQRNETMPAWHHFAIVAAEDLVTLYVNGVLELEASSNLLSQPINTSYVWFEPYIAFDNVKIWNKSITHAEVVASMKSTITSSQPDLIMSMSFDNDTRVITADTKDYFGPKLNYGSIPDFTRFMEIPAPCGISEICGFNYVSQSAVCTDTSVSCTQDCECGEHERCISGKCNAQSQESGERCDPNYYECKEGLLCDSQHAYFDGRGANSFCTSRTVLPTLSCSSSSQCLFDTMCISGVCTPIPDFDGGMYGDVCSDASECFSGICLGDGICGCAEQYDCTTEGAFCDVDNTCHARFAVGEACADNLECESLSCASGTCSCNPYSIEAQSCEYYQSCQNPCTPTDNVPVCMDAPCERNGMVGPGGLNCTFDMCRGIQLGYVGSGIEIVKAPSDDVTTISNTKGLFFSMFFFSPFAPIMEETPLIEFGYQWRFSLVNYCPNIVIDVPEIAGNVTIHDENCTDFAPAMNSWIFQIQFSWNFADATGYFEIGGQRTEFTPNPNFTSLATEFPIIAFTYAPAFVDELLIANDPTGKEDWIAFANFNVNDDVLENDLPMPEPKSLSTHPALPGWSEMDTNSTGSSPAFGYVAGSEVGLYYDFYIPYTRCDNEFPGSCSQTYPSMETTCVSCKEHGQRWFGDGSVCLDGASFAASSYVVFQDWELPMNYIYMLYANDSIFGSATPFIENNVTYESCISNIDWVTQEGDWPFGSAAVFHNSESNLFREPGNDESLFSPNIVQEVVLSFIVKIVNPSAETRGIWTESDEQGTGMYVIVTNDTLSLIYITSEAEEWVLGSTTITPNEWHHVSVYNLGGYFLFVVDGEKAVQNHGYLIPADLYYADINATSDFATILGKNVKYLSFEGYLTNVALSYDVYDPIYAKASYFVWQNLKTANFDFTVNTVPPVCYFSTTGEISIGEMFGGSGYGNYSYSLNNDTWEGDLTTFPVGTTVTIEVEDMYTTCRAPTKTITIVAPPQIGFTPSATPVCLSNNDASATGVATGGNPVNGYTYTWQTSLTSNVTSPTVTGLTKGTSYTVFVSDGGCEAVFTVTVPNTDPLSISASTPVNPTCAASSDGSIAITVAGGAGGAYTYSWSQNGNVVSAASTLTGVTGGEYEVSVSAADDVSCVLKQSFTLTAPAALSLEATAFNATFGAIDGSVSISISGGTAPYTATLGSLPISGNSISGVAPGTYTVNVVDHAGCTTSAQVTVLESPVPGTPTTGTPTTATGTPTTGTPTTGTPTTGTPTTASPTTASPTTASPTTASPTTASPTTASPTTASPTTASPTTASPTTGTPTTGTSGTPTTGTPTTGTPTTASPTTASPTTASPTTASPTTASPTTASPTTASPTTASPTTASPTTASPTTASPTTASPTTASPTTASPTTASPTTASPTTASPTTASPTTASPTTAQSTSGSPTTGSSTTGSGSTIKVTVVVVIALSGDPALFDTTAFAQAFAASTGFPVDQVVVVIVQSQTRKRADGTFQVQVNATQNLPASTPASSLALFNSTNLEAAITAQVNNASSPINAALTGYTFEGVNATSQITQPSTTTTTTTSSTPSTTSSTGEPIESSATSVFVSVLMTSLVAIAGVLVL